MKQTKLIVDRKEGTFAVCEIGRALVDLPSVLFPEGLKNGRHALLTIEWDEESERNLRESISDLQDELRARHDVEVKQGNKLGGDKS